MRRGPIYKWQPKPSFIFASCDTKYHPVLAPVSRCYPDLVGRLPTCYSPVRRSFHIRPPEGFCMLPALDLHVLGTPPAFVLSQDQTLQKSLHTISKNNMSLSLLLKNGYPFLDIIGCSVQFSKSNFCRIKSLFSDELYCITAYFYCQLLFVKIFRCGKHCCFDDKK